MSTHISFATMLSGFGQWGERIKGRVDQFLEALMLCVAHVCVCVCVCVFAHTHDCVCVCMCVGVFAHMRKCVCVCMCV